MSVIGSRIFLAVALTIPYLAQFCNAFSCQNPHQNITAATRHFFPANKWPNKIVKFELHSSLKPEDGAVAHKAFNDIQSKTCIRFEPRSNWEPGYVSIERDDNSCAWADTCYTGRKQSVVIGGHCGVLGIFVHQLGHSLCLLHEHQRFDRDEYLDFSSCPANEIPQKESYDTKGYLYDYVSTMAYQCGNCLGGWPTISEVTQCGLNIRPGLSVLDADKINDLYECQGCYSHRWKRIESLTNEDKANLYSFGSTSGYEPLYVCRAQVGNEIATGTYRTDTGECNVAYGGQEYVFREEAQVLTIPDDVNGNIYTLVKFKDMHLYPNMKPVPVGRKGNGVEGYAAVALFVKDGKKETAIGKAWSDESGTAFIGYDWKEHMIVDNYYVLVCGPNSHIYSTGK